MGIIPFGEWLPDRPDLSEGTRYASGVIPITPDSYGPMRQLQPFSVNTIGSQCFGAAALEDVYENMNVFAGTATGLYEIPAGSSIWVTVGSGYTHNTGENWRFAQFNGIALATDFVDPIQAFTMGSSTAFAELSSGAPNARHIAVASNFCIVANTNDPVGGYNPARIWWSANGDPTNWPTPGTNAAQQVQSDYNDLVGEMGGITGLAPNLAGCNCAVFFERGVFQMIYVGPPDVFNFYPAAAVKGVRASNSLVTLNGLVYGLFEDGFYQFDGNTATPIGGRQGRPLVFSEREPGGAG